MDVNTFLSLSIEEISQRTKLHMSTWYRWINEERKPKGENLEEAAHKLDMDILDLKAALKLLRNRKKLEDGW